MKVKVKTKVLYHDQLGQIVAGDVVDLHDSQASSWVQCGWVEPVAEYDTKVVQQTPVTPVERGRKAK